MNDEEMNSLMVTVIFEGTKEVVYSKGVCVCVCVSVCVCVCKQEKKTYKDKRMNFMVEE